MSLTIGSHPTFGSSSNNSVTETMVSDESKKHNHSEIEKRRRDKMNHYITELSCLIPMCNAMSRKLDKLTVLRMAVQHMKTIKGSMNAFSGSAKMRPTFLSDEALLKLISRISEGFLFVVSCDRGRILFVSGSVSQILNYSQGDLLGQNWFDILHPKDVAKVKEQLSSSDLSPKERLIDAKTMLPVKSTPSPSSQANMSPGARRSFFCRMKFKSMPRVKEEADTTTGYAQKRRKSQSSDRKYCVVHCIGYLKSWISTKMSVTEDSTESESDIYNMSCLVAIGRTLPNLSGPSLYRPDIAIKPISFTSRHTIDGKFLFVDQRATLILGYLPQELLGTCCYEYCHHEDLKILAESHRLGLEASGEYSKSARYRFKTKSGPYIYLQTTWKIFRNPWTKEFEFLIAVNTCVSDVDIVESSVNGESNNANNYNITSNRKTSSTVDEILFRISDSCKNKANKPHNGNHSQCNNNGGNNNSSSNSTNSGGTGGSGSSLGGGGGGNISSNEQSSTGYSSTDTRSVQKMLASSRVALWKIGRYIADEVLENQRRCEESNCLLSSSPYTASPQPHISDPSFTHFASSDSMSGFDVLKKWRPDSNVNTRTANLVTSPLKLPPPPIIQSETQVNHSSHHHQQQHLVNNSNTCSNTNDKHPVNCNNSNGVSSKNSNSNNNIVNDCEVNSNSNTNAISNSNLWMDSGSTLTTLTTAAAVINDGDLSLSRSNNQQSSTSVSSGNCSMETDSSSYHGTNGAENKLSYRHENAYDPLVGGSGAASSGGSASGVENAHDSSSLNDPNSSSNNTGSQTRPSTNCLTSFTCIDESSYYRTTKAASLSILPESSNETEDGPSQMDETMQLNTVVAPAAAADDQENEDAAMDLIMSILEADGRLGCSGFNLDLNYC